MGSSTGKCKYGSVRDMEQTHKRMVVADFILLDPFCDLIFILLLDIAINTALESVETIDRRPSSLTAALVNVRVSVVSAW